MNSEDIKKLLDDPEITATAIQMQHAQLRQVKMIYRVCEALLTGKIDSQTVRFAEEFIEVNEMFVNDKEE